MEVLYVFGGEKAQGAEIVIERLMLRNVPSVNAHLFIAPGNFANELLKADKPYRITLVEHLKKLNRSKTGKLAFLMLAIKNYIMVSVLVLKYIRKNRIAFVHANTIVPASYLLPSIVLSKVFNPRVKWLWSDHDIKYFSKFENLLARWCVKWYHRTLVVSLAVKRKYMDNPKVEVLYNGLDTDVFKPNPLLRQEFRGGFNLTDDKLVFGIAGSICPGKGQLALIQVFERLTKAYNNVILFVAGSFGQNDDSYNEAVRAAVDANPNIIFIGYLNNVIPFYNGCDVIVSNSDLERSESLGTTIYEAMACGKIVVASATGGTPEIITDKQNGYLFEADNKAALHNALEYVIKNYNELGGIKQAAMQKVSLRFNINTMLINYNRVLEDIMADRLNTDSVAVESKNN